MVNVIYCTDENYARYCAVSIYSLLNKNQFLDKINIFVIINNVSENMQKKILEVCNKYTNATLNFIKNEELCDEFEKNNEYSLSYYSRLFLENLPNEINKAIYIDCDTLINNSIEELFKYNIENYYFAAVQDTIQPFNLELIGRNKFDRYINSGVLLINLKKWREEKLKEKFKEFIERYNGNVPHHDQGILNGVCGDKILYLSPKYNLMPEMIYMNTKQIKKLYKIKEFYSEEELQEAQKSPVIIHFLTKWYNRPWYKSCTHPYKEDFLWYLNNTSMDKGLLEGDIKSRIKFQKFLYKHFPFCFFIIIQRIFDIRRLIIGSVNCKKRELK